MILIIEDNEILLESLKAILINFWYKVEWKTEIENIDFLKYDLILLDINLKWTSWFDLLKYFKENNINIPIIIITARSSLEDQLTWLNLWAIDYITKPFDIPSLILKIKNILSRYYPEKININDVEIDLINQKVYKNWHEIKFSSLEFNVLKYLIKNKNRPVNAKELYDAVWGDFEDKMFSRSLDVIISKIRKKIWWIIKTKKWSWYYIEI